MEKFYVLFIDTLNLFLLPKKEITISYKSTIQNSLDELEGDYFTFLFKEEINKLFKAGYIKNETVQKIETVREAVGNLEKTLWEPDKFINDVKWKIIRELVIDILNTL